MYTKALTRMAGLMWVVAILIGFFCCAPVHYRSCTAGEPNSYTEQLDVSSVASVLFLD